MKVGDIVYYRSPYGDREPVMILIEAIDEHYVWYYNDNYYHYVPAPRAFVSSQIPKPLVLCTIGDDI